MPTLPKKPPSVFQAFDFAGWQERLSYSNDQAALALDVSRSFFLELRRKNGGRKIYAWAAYGIEQAKKAQTT